MVYPVPHGDVVLHEATSLQCPHGCQVACKDVSEDRLNVASFSQMLDAVGEESGANSLTAQCGLHEIVVQIANDLGFDKIAG